MERVEGSKELIGRVGEIEKLVEVMETVGKSNALIETARAIALMQRIGESKELV